MSLPGEREGFPTKIAFRKQSAPGVPISAAEWVDDDVLRVDSGFTPDPQIETLGNIPTGTGSPFPQDEAVKISGIKPLVSGVVKATPRHLRTLIEANMNKAPTLSAGPIGTNHAFTGSAIGIQPMTLVWDDSLEALRAFDIFLHTLAFNSVAGEALLLNVDAQGGEFDDALLTPQLAGVNLSNFTSYAHKESIIQDFIGGTTIPIFAIEQSLRMQWSLVERGGNKVQPSFIGKARHTITGQIRTRLYDDTKAWINRILKLTRSKLTMQWEQDDGKLLTVNLENVTFSGKPAPDVRDDGTMDDFIIDFEARRSGIGGAATDPFTIIVED